MVLFRWFLLLVTIHLFDHHLVQSFTTIHNSPPTSRQRSSQEIVLRLEQSDDPEHHLPQTVPSLVRRTILMVSGGAPFLGLGGPWTEQAEAANGLFPKKRGLYVVDTRDDIADAVLTEQVDIPVPTLSSEYALLKVLPVKNPVFRSLEQNLEAVSALRFAENRTSTTGSAWTKAQKSADAALKTLTSKRAQLEPVFNPEETTAVAIFKGERGEILIEQLREELIQLSNATNVQNLTNTFDLQQQALVTLGFIGELLVREFPYRVPSRGKFSFLPRLLGRARVTMRFKRAGAILGNVTIVADGYTAPITAGNFVDLAKRNFYTGLPIKSVNKRFGTNSNQFVVPVNIFGSFNEGFFDPLTAKLRRIPLEIIRLEKSTGLPKLSYSTQGSPDVLIVCKTCLEDVSEEDASFTAALSSKPLLSFDTPGLVGMNHPYFNPNGASSEFFCLTDEIDEEQKNSLDGEYAPFGYIISGYEIWCELEPDDVIDATVVDEFGQLNLVRIRESNFKEAAQGLEAGAE